MREGSSLIGLVKLERRKAVERIWLISIGLNNLFLVKLAPMTTAHSVALSPIWNFLCGGVAGQMATLVVQPFEVMKLRLQISSEA